MVECEWAKTCPFFLGKLKCLPIAAGIYKKTFCQGKFEKCARYVIAKYVGKEKVPDDLYPAMREEALKLFPALKSKLSS